MSRNGTGITGDADSTTQGYQSTPNEVNSKGCDTLTTFIEASHSFNFTLTNLNKAK